MSSLINANLRIRDFRSGISFLATLVFLLVAGTAFAGQTFESKYEGGIQNTREGVNVSAEQLVTENKSGFDLGDHDGYRLERTERDATGMDHYRYQQTFDGIPVLGAELIVHSRNGIVEKFNGEIVKSLEMSATPSITESLALDAALSYFGAEEYMWQSKTAEQRLKERRNDANATYFPTPKLVIVNEDDRFSHDPSRFVLAYELDLFASKPYDRKYVYVDASTGDVVKTITRIHPGWLGVADTEYDGSRFVHVTTQLPGWPNYFYVLEEDEDRNIKAWNMNDDFDYDAATGYMDNDNSWTADPIAYQGYYSAEKTWDFYSSRFSREGFDGNGSRIDVYMHANDDPWGYLPNNAFWDGERVTFGDGDGVNRGAFTALDIVGHEISHGVVQHTADLVYNYESGALNESFADIFGTCIEFTRGRDVVTWEPYPGNWTIGEDVVLNGLGFIRSMSNPKAAGDPDTYFGTNWHTGSGGMHTNSGVQNHWFYLLCEGGSGTNDNGDSYDVTGIGMEKAEQIAYRNLSVYLTSTSDYADARTGAISAAEDLYGVCSPEAIATAEAWYAVGVGSEDDYDCPTCMAGDADGSGGVDIDDVIYIIEFVFLGGPAPVPEECCGDANGSGSVDIDDIVYLIAYIFGSGSAPVNACEGQTIARLVAPVKGDILFSARKIDLATVISISISADEVVQALQLDFVIEGEVVDVSVESVNDGPEAIFSREDSRLTIGVIDLYGRKMIDTDDEVLQITYRGSGELRLDKSIAVKHGGGMINLVLSSKSTHVVPEGFGMGQNYPNPFNPSTRISFSLPVATDARLEVFNVLGQKVTTLVDEYLPAGEHEVTWNADGNASGVYFYRLSTGDYSETKRMMLVK